MFTKSPEKVLKDNAKICGLDEVGRGPLAGPVTASCVYIPKESMELPFWSDVTDSKKLSAKKRELLSVQIQQHSIFGMASCSVEEIDTLNILQASLLAMERSFSEMSKNAAVHDFYALIDGNQTPKNMPCPSETVIKGDSKHLQIAAASILAKVHRDKVMKKLHEEFPYYGWDTNSGYGSKKHLEALATFGPTPHHRRSFAPVKSMLVA